MVALLAVGPLELVVGSAGLVSALLMLYGVYKLGYRIGRAEGALQERDRLPRS